MVTIGNYKSCNNRNITSLIRSKMSFQTSLLRAQKSLMIMIKIKPPEKFIQTALQKLLYSVSLLTLRLCYNQSLVLNFNPTKLVSYTKWVNINFFTVAVSETWPIIERISVCCGLICPPPPSYLIVMTACLTWQG